MMTPRERYLADPHFHLLVDLFIGIFEEHCGSGAGVTPTEIREASGLAWQSYVERHPSPLFLHQEDVRHGG